MKELGGITSPSQILKRWKLRMHDICTGTDDEGELEGFNRVRYIWECGYVTDVPLVISEKYTDHSMDNAETTSSSGEK